MSEQKTFFLDSDFEDVNLTPQPVTCLGMTFESDDIRREYFRNELRNMLPELRKIEGFPIGEDDDIVSLSDPPYYTACPNPWLSDFIAEWEKEKEQLKKEGKRTDNFDVKEPYASDVSEGKNNPIYNAHSYHTKVPHPAIMRYLFHYTQPGDIVLDGFAGTGMTGVAANFAEDSKSSILSDMPYAKCGLRHAILSDLSPVASLISANYNIPHKCDYKSIEKKLNLIEEKYSRFYKTKHNNTLVGTINYVVWSDVFVCPNCGGKVVFYDVAVDEESGKVADTFKCSECGCELTKKTADKSWQTEFDETLGESISTTEKIPVLINYSVGKKSYNKKPDAEDLALINEAKRLSSKFSYVNMRMTEGSEARRNDRQGLTHVHHFYFPRTLLVLEELFKVADCKEFLFMINSQLINISKLNRYRPGVSFPYNPLSGTLYIGSQISEANPFIALRNKLKKMSTAFDMINNYNVTSVASATSLNLPDNCIDYIFTDPPFGANISYSELNFIQESWLKVCTNNNKEAIENNSLGKSRNDYQSLMESCLKEYYRVLKPGKWMTVEFSNTSASIWNAIQQAIQNAGFITTNVAALDKQQGSFKAVTTTTAVKQDLIITCFKPTERLSSNIYEGKGDKTNVWDFVTELLQHLPIHLLKDYSTTAVVERSPKILFDRMVSYYVQLGLPVPMDAIEFQKGLKLQFIERDGMYFTASQALEYEEKRSKSDGFVPMALFIASESDGIEWLKRKLETPKTYQELQPDWMKDLVAPKKGDVLPGLDVILEENFIKDVDGKWGKPDPENATHLEQLRGKRLMKEFNLYLEAAKKPKAKRMKDTRLEVLRYGFKDCYKQKNYQDIVTVGDHIQESLLMEDEILLQYYDIAVSRI